MHFFLSSISLVYVLTTPILEDGENATMEQIRRRNKWENDDYVCRGLILNGMSDPLFDIHYNVDSSKELWDSLEAKYMVDDASSKKFLDSDKPKGNNVAGPLLVNMVEHNDSIRDCKGRKVGNKANGSGTNDSVNGSSNSLKGLSQRSWGEAMLTAYFLLNRVPNKRNMITLYEIWTKRKPNLNYLRGWGCRAVVTLSDPKLKTLGEKGIECIFVGYARHFKAFWFHVIEHNESVLINSIIESMDIIFDENRFSSVPRPILSIPNETDDIVIS
ncbi:hypothetical protein Tco_0377207 [Tanacetum coccineum]